MRVGLPGRLRSPGALLGAGAGAVALVCAITAAQISVLASLDETVYKLAGVNFAESFPSALGSDQVSRGAARLYSLLLAPLFVLLEGDQAVRVGRALNGVLWAATAVPVYFVARRVIATQRGAVAAAVLAVAVPWLTVSLILFSEALSYLLFACAVVAMLRALEAPSLWRDATAIAVMVVLVTARMQFAVLPVAWFVLVAGFEWRRGARRDPRAALRRFPVTFGLAALSLAGALGLVVLGGLSGELDRFGGPYAGLKEQGLPRDAGVALLSQVALIALGVGLVAGVLAAAWYRDALRSRLGDPALRFAVLSLALVVALFASTIWAQGGWLDARTEERYYIYAVPFVWIAAVAALRDVATLSAGRLLGGGLVLAAVLFLVPITVGATGEQMFLGPVSGVVADATPRVDDLVTVTRRDLAGWTAVVVAVAAALLWRRRREAALALSVALQLGLVLYALAAAHGRMDPIPGVLTGESFAGLGWIDRALPGDTQVGLVENGGVSRDLDVLHSAFWNDAVRSRVALAGDPSAPPYPANRLSVFRGEPGADGALPGTPPQPLVVAVRDAPLWQVEGRELDRSPDGRLALLDTGGRITVPWRTAGLDDDLQISKPVSISALGGRTYVLRFAPPAPGETGQLRLKLGDRSQTVVTDRDGEQAVSVDLCQETGIVSGSIELQSAAAQVSPGRYSAGQLPAVKVQPC